MANIKHHFKLSELNSKISNLESNQFEEYLNTFEKQTVNDEFNMHHIIMTCTKGYYEGIVVDIYYSELTKVCYLEYSGQRKDTKVTAVI